MRPGAGAGARRRRRWRSASACRAGSPRRGSTARRCEVPVRPTTSRNCATRAKPAAPASVKPSASTVATFTPSRPHSCTASTRGLRPGHDIGVLRHLRQRRERWPGALPQHRVAPPIDRIDASRIARAADISAAGRRSCPRHSIGRRSRSSAARAAPARARRSPVCVFEAMALPRTRCTPSPRWGEGWGEGVPVAGNRSCSILFPAPLQCLQIHRCSRNAERDNPWLPRPAFYRDRARSLDRAAHHRSQ